MAKMPDNDFFIS